MEVVTDTIAKLIIAEALLREGKDVVGNIYKAFRDVEVYVTLFMAEERERERGKEKC